MENKLCQKCNTLKPRKEFSNHILKRDGLQPFCKSCDNSRNRKSRWSTIGGVTSQIINRHGMSQYVARIIAARLFDPYERCFICGIPNRILSLHIRQGYPFIWGKPEINRRLTVDHITPGGPSVLGNLRLLCYPCNARRGANIRSDQQVLNWIRWKWLDFYTLNECWWLNETPNQGGLAVRSKRHQELVHEEPGLRSGERTIPDNLAIRVIETNDDLVARAFEE